jgi:chemosensory pili system protein ChpA (sensor histidine kinase/response regulator)
LPEAEGAGAPEAHEEAAPAPVRAEEPAQPAAPRAADAEEPPLTDEEAELSFELADELQGEETGEPEARAAEAQEPGEPRDELIEELLPGFFEEGGDLLAQIEDSLGRWGGAPGAEELDQLARPLHTIKGGARQAGAFSVGQIAHEMESALAQARRGAGGERLRELGESLKLRFAQLRTQPQGPVSAPKEAPGAFAGTSAGERPAQPRRPVAARPRLQGGSRLRVRAETIESLSDSVSQSQALNAAMLAHSAQLGKSLGELGEASRRASQLLRELQLQVESQMQARVKEVSQTHGEFDPLELDRFTRAQEITRALAETLQDAGAAQEAILAESREQEGIMARKERLSESMQKELTEARLVSLGSSKGKLEQTVALASRDAGKSARLEFTERGMEARIDRSVIERLIQPIEHLLRNALAHGIEPAQARQESGKGEQGLVRIDARHEGNVLFIEIEDDGAGLNEERVEKKAREAGLLAPDEPATSERLIEMLFLQGFSTASGVSELAGRGVGMNIVKNEIEALGGQIEARSQPGEGMRWTIALPVAVATMQAALVEADGQVWAIPTDLIDEIRSLRPQEARQLESQGQALSALGSPYRFAWLAKLLGGEANPAAGRLSALMLSFGSRRVAAVADRLIGSAQIVVKPLGRHLARAPGLLGAAQLPDGRLALIVNPVQLKEPAATARAKKPAKALSTRPLVIVVDDSLTIRMATSQVLERWGYDALLAKDGQDALEKLADSERAPSAMLLDVDMPRMDGFELARRLRAPESRWRKLPIAMITSRVAQKHRDRAFEIGVDAFLGKPFEDEELQTLLREFVARPASGG